MVLRSVTTTRIHRGIVTYVRTEAWERRAVPATSAPLQGIGVRWMSSLEGGNRGPGKIKTYTFEEVRFNVPKLKIGGVDAV
jgi:hypothetical protein